MCIRDSRYTGITSYTKNGIQYSWSNGWLLYPKNYNSYGQTNLNFYVELIGQQLINDKAHFLDIAPSIQLIFNSQSKLNLGYRWALIDNTNRMNDRSLYLSFDYLFFNALPKLCLLYTSPSPRDGLLSRMPSSA